jgi:hypothetical protein
MATVLVRPDNHQGQIRHGDASDALDPDELAELLSSTVALVMSPLPLKHSLRWKKELHFSFSLSFFL